MKEKNITGNKLTHMTHIEDMIVFGEDSASLALDTIKQLYETLKGHSTSLNITLKIDGSPSIIAASDFNGQAFVATKGFFSTTERKYATTEDEVRKYYSSSEDLLDKMLSMFRYVKSIGIPAGEIWQGDFLFKRNQINHLELDGKKCVTFQPNTIVYAIEESDPIAKMIEEAEIGIAWHTVYLGDNFENLKVDFSPSLANVNRLNYLPQVFQIDARLPSVVGKGTFTENESKFVESEIETIEKLCNSLFRSNFYRLLEQSSSLYVNINAFRNSVIKQGFEDLDKINADNFINYMYNKAMSKEYKTERSRVKHQEETDKFKELLTSYRDDINTLFNIQNYFLTLKELFMKKLENLGNFRTFVRYISKGYLPCGQEGYAISDIYGNVQKLVSRLEFSRNNFSQDVVKGWISETRK